MAKAKRSGRGSQRGSRRGPRSLASFRRAPGRRSRECILIVCDGRETEPNYFESLRRELKLGTVQVQVEGGGGAPVSVVRRAVAAKEQRRREAQQAERAGASSPPPEFDRVWCVFDTEIRENNPSFTAAVNQARKNTFHLAVSNPAFEYWYLLHFAETSQPFRDGAEVISALRKHLPDYRKNADVFRRVCRFTPEAIQRAGRVRAGHTDPDDPFPNPSTLVYRLVETMTGMANFVPCQ